MDLIREQELELFRKVNGANKTWNIFGRRSYVDSTDEIDLRQNQGKAKAKFIKYFISNKEEFLKGVTVIESDMQE